MTDDKSGLASALAALQTQLPEIRKTESANAGSYSYKYADLAGVSARIMPLLGGHGLAFLAKPTFNGEGRFVLAYSLLHVSGEREDGEYPLPADAPPQTMGSAITYGRRYCLCAVTGVAPDDEDDDGAAASQPQAQARSDPLAPVKAEVWAEARRLGYASIDDLDTHFQRWSEGQSIRDADGGTLAHYRDYLRTLETKGAETDDDGYAG